MSNDLRRVIKLSLVIFFAAICLQHFPTLFAKLVKKDVEFKRVSDSVLSADIHSLPIGTYFVSAGRSYQPCSIFLDHSLIKTIVSAREGATSDLLLSASFKKTENGESPQKIDLVCQNVRKGLLFSHEPVVTEFDAGVILNILRTINSVLAVTFSAAFLFFIISIQLFSRLERDFKKRLVLFGFSFITLLYGLSLCHISHLFMSFENGYAIHRVLRNIWALSFVGLNFFFSGKKRVSLGLLTIVLTVLSFAFNIYSNQLGKWFYYFQYLFFPVVSFVVSYDVFSSNANRKHLLSAVFLAGGFLQLVDFTTLIRVSLLHSSNDLYLVPGFIISLVVVMLYNSYNEYIEIRVQKENALTKVRMSEELSRMATALSHDIRSPLTALSFIQSRITVLGEEEKLLLKNVINRIQTMANNLLDQNRAYKASDEKSCVSKDLLNSIASLIQEKALEFPYANINFQIEDEEHIRASKGIRVQINRTEFMRLLSNLINNAVEACNESNAKIRILIKKTKDEIITEISDNGKGIPASVLPKLMQKGFSYEKANGNGLGLAAAKELVELFGGSIKISSHLMLGTTVKVNLKLKCES